MFNKNLRKDIIYIQEALKANCISKYSDYNNSIRKLNARIDRLFKYLNVEEYQPDCKTIIRKKDEEDNDLGKT